MAPQVPQPEPDDCPGVLDALAAATAMLEQGDRTEAIRRLQEAAQAAAESADDARAVELAMAAANLRDAERSSTPTSPTAPETPSLSEPKSNAAHAQTGELKVPPALEPSIRVSVKASVRDPNLLLVRVLNEGESAPKETREAFLTPAQAGVDLRCFEP